MTKGSYSSLGKSDARTMEVSLQDGLNHLFLGHLLFHCEIKGPGSYLAPFSYISNYNNYSVIRADIKNSPKGKVMKEICSLSEYI